LIRRAKKRKDRGELDSDLSSLGKGRVRGTEDDVSLENLSKKKERVGRVGGEKSILYALTLSPSKGRIGIIFGFWQETVYSKQGGKGRNRGA